MISARAVAIGAFLSMAYDPKQPHNFSGIQISDDVTACIASSLIAQMVSLLSQTDPVFARRSLKIWLFRAFQNPQE